MRSVLFSLILCVFPLTAASAPQYLDTQYGEGQLEVHLLRAKRHADLLTVVLRYELPESASSKSYRYPLEEVYYLADGNKYFVMKDENGRYLASPKRDSYGKGGKLEEDLAVHVRSASSSVVWFKFPAPPQGVTQIQLQVPEISPFDITVQ